MGQKVLKKWRHGRRDERHENENSSIVDDPIAASMINQRLEFEARQ